MTRQEIQSIKALKNRAERALQNRFIVEGEKSIFELCSSSLTVQRIYCLDSMFDALANAIDAKHHPNIQSISTKEMGRISQMATPPGMLALAELPSIEAKDVLENIEKAPLPFGAVCCDIKDPGNLGTLIRSADWFGMGGILISNGTVDPWSQKCVQASMGSIFRLPVAVADIENIEGLYHYHLEMHGNPYTEIEWKPGLIWIGSESHGFNFHSIPNTSVPVHIPKRGQADSLNAGLAGGIVFAHLSNCWEKKI